MTACNVAVSAAFWISCCVSLLHVDNFQMFGLFQYFLVLSGVVDL
jgi:hypothetical protein